MPVNVGGVMVGGDNPIVVQSMTNTDTADVTGTATQVMALAKAGSEVVRVTVNSEDAAKALPRVVDTIRCTAATCRLWGISITTGTFC